MQNNDLIFRAAAIDEIEEYLEEYSELEPETGYHNLKWCAMEEAKDALLALPAADAVQVVHGRWIDHKDEHQCSACKEFTVVDAYAWIQLQYDFCPHCGARMDRGDDK